VYVFLQAEVSHVQSTVDGTYIPGEVTDSCMQPVVVLEKLDLIR